MKAPGCNSPQPATTICEVPRCHDAPGCNSPQSAPPALVNSRGDREGFNVVDDNYINSQFCRAAPDGALDMRKGAPMGKQFEG